MVFPHIDKVEVKYKYTKVHAGKFEKTLTLIFL